MTNEFDVSLSVPTASLSVILMTSMREDSLMMFPLRDVTNPFCWLASFGGLDSIEPIDTSAEQRSTWIRSLDLPTLEFVMSSFRLDSACGACSSPGVPYLSDIFRELEELGFNSRFGDQLQDLVQELLVISWDNLNVNGLLAEAPKYCANHPSFESDAPPLELEWPSISSLSSEGTETVSAVSVIGLHAAIVATAKNHLPTPRSTGKRHLTEYVESSEIVDWTALSRDYGGWIEFAFEEFRKYLSEPVKENFKRDASMTIRANALLREFALDEDGVYKIDPGETINFEVLGVTVSLSEILVHGLDSLKELDALVPSGPLTLESRFQAEKMKIDFVFNVESGGEMKTMRLSYSVRDLSANVEMLVAMDLQRLGSIQLGSIFDLDRIAFCFISGFQELEFLDLDISFGSIDEPVVDGFFSENNRESVDFIVESIFEAHRGEFLAAIPVFFDSTFREIVNSLLPQTLESLGNKCVPPTEFPLGGAIDFRDLLLPSSSSRFLGGSGDMPYGNLFVNVCESMKENIFRLGASNRPLINDLLRVITEKQSNATGVISFPGNAFDNVANIKIAGLEAEIGFALFDVSIERLDSVGDPLDLFRPTFGQPPGPIGGPVFKQPPKHAGKTTKWTTTKPPRSAATNPAGRRGPN